ncbi:MAG: hypothetical protein KGD58_05950 [Candidatus Lokiarchaeota archaeon]|nr:hypothetical protein [Candidatus Lokiarchaeota archaeon]
MSYIEKKYNSKIKEVFEELLNLDENLLSQLNKKSVKNINEIAKLCADFNHNINLILKKYYPEIKAMDDKLDINSTLKFYYDLIFYLTDLVRNIENFHKIDQEYYDKLIEFIHDKNDLISGKYRNICTQELTAFYDQNSRQNLEKVLIEKIERKSRNYFTFGSLEEEIKKIALVAGAVSVVISVEDTLSKEDLESAKSIIMYEISEDQDFRDLAKIGEEIKKYLDSKNYESVIKNEIVITDAKLLPD